MTMLPEAILLPNYAYWGYRATLPLFGLLVIAGELACYFMESNYKRVVSGILLTGCLAASILLGAVTREKVPLWGNPILFWEDAVKSFPEGEGKIEKKVVAEILSNLGHSHIRYGFVPDSLVPLEQAVKEDPWNTIAHYNLASAYSEVGRLKEAEKQLRVAALLAPGNPLITNLLSNINKKVQAR
ncbi:MAG: tetratricopeptide repeat protein [Desulfomonilaceae bacterium]